MSDKPLMRVALVGYAFMGAAHSQAWRNAHFVRDVRAGTPPAPSFADGLYVQRVLDAVERSSAASSSWTEIG